MGTLHTITAPPPSLYVAGDRPPVANAYFAVTVEAAVDLLEAREYRDLPRPERLAKAQAEQQTFLGEFFDPGLGMALDLRIAADPAAAEPLSVSLLGRVWGGSLDAVTARAESLRAQVRAAVPRHVIASPVEDADAVVRLLSPFGGASVDSSVITRHELIGPPSRPDAGVSYYFSAEPFTLSDNDWSAVYSALTASRVPVVLSMAVLPMPVPPPFAQTLVTLANYYARLAKEGEQETGTYRGRARLAPDAFAVDAEKAFRGFSRRLSQRAFALRIQLSAAKQLPPGIVEAVAEAISPAERSVGLPEHQRATACEVRRPASAAERRLAEYNLNVVNVAMVTGRQEIWGRHDPPDPQLAMLSVLGDARDASCAFRFPIAVDGVVPGFPVRRGLFGQAAAYQLTGQVIRLGKASGSGRDVAVPLRSLAKGALIAGSAGTGKTTTAVEILRQLWTDHEVPFLVIEPENDADGYRALAGEPGFESLEVITAGDEQVAPLRFNPFEVPAGMLVGEHVANLLACFTAAFGLSGPLPSIYLEALNLTYLRAGVLSSERPTGTGRSWPTVVEFLDAVSEVTEGLGHDGDLAASAGAAAVRRVRSLVRGAAGSALLTDRPNDVGSLLDHPVVLELGPLGPGDEQALMMALVLNAITEHRRSVTGASSSLVHVTLVAEAHRLLARAEGAAPGTEARARERAATAFAHDLADNRGYGEGVILGGRFPAKLVADAVKNSNLKLTHRLTAEDDRRYLGDITGLDEAQRLLVARLKPGEAMLYSDEFAEAAEVTIAEPPPAAAPPAPVLRLPVFGSAGLRPTGFRPAAPPFAACAPCRAQCVYRGAALSMVNDSRIVSDVTKAADAADTDGLAALRDSLYGAVGRFPALPAADPGRADAAFCLFLHVYSTSGLHAMPAWPSVAAGLLGLTDGTNRDSATED